MCRRTVGWVKAAGHEANFAWACARVHWRMAGRTHGNRQACTLADAGLTWTRGCLRVEETRVVGGARCERWTAEMHVVARSEAPAIGFRLAQGKI
ncbi:hypothetical protein TIFTF001_028577 [Ficus carica]|uniref:Uncharacterized protein n=1 Tax=Ficus carica TaxID=3494 RepID=A0AA88DQ86_FICCA|nr:hypothetical protein TIFTF001_028577 [Ficus carica]